MLSQIIKQAHEYKDEFYRERVVTCHNNKLTNRERELLFVANRIKFNDEADKNYWKTIAELLPNEVPTIEKRKVKKAQEKKPSIDSYFVIQSDYMFFTCGNLIFCLRLA